MPMKPERASTSAAFRESDERQTFLLALGDAFRAAPDVGTIGAICLERLARYLQLDRCFLNEMRSEDNLARVGPEYHALGLMPVSGEHRYEDFPESVRRLETGEPVVLSDVADDASITDLDKASLAAMGIGAVLVGALRRGNGNSIFALTVATVGPRQWTRENFNLVQEVGERTWLAIERMRVETELRASEAKYRTLFERMGQGYDECEMIRDASGQAIDYRILDMNPAFERLIGISVEEARGRPVSEVIPGLESWWVDTFDAMLRTNEPVRIEREVPGLGRWYEVSAYPQGGDRFAALFEDITERKRTDQVLRASEERQAFLLALSDALRPLSNTDEVRHRAMNLLGEYLKTARAFYYEAERDADGWVHVATSDYHQRADMPSLVGRYPQAALGPALFEHLAGREVLVVPDVAGVPGLTPVQIAWYRAMVVGSLIAVPLHKDGLYVGGVCVADSGPRQWTRAEISLVEAVGERTWAAVERAHAEAALREREERLTVALEAGRMGTYRLDLRTGQQEWSDGQYDIFGLTKGIDIPSRDLFLSLVHKDDHHRIEFTANDIREPGTHLDSEFRIIRPDGEMRWITAHALAVFGSDGRPAELIGVNIDVTEQRKLEAAMHATEERLQQFSEASSDVLWTRRADTLQWEYLSPGFHRIYGISRQDALRGDNLTAWTDLIVPEDRERVLGNIGKVAEGERVAFEYRVRRPEDGEIRWLRDTDFPIRDESGTVVLIGGIGHDLTELKRAEEHQRLLLAELQHRVRNTLAVIRSIVRRSAATTGSRDDLFIHADARIAAFARIQAAVTRDPAKPLDLASLVAEELRTVGAQEDGNLTIKGPPVGLTAKAAETLGLAIHELATNAMKYGALTAEHGRIDVAWEVVEAADEPHLRFVWTERGLRNLPAVPTRKGFGTEILERTLPYELHGTTVLDFARNGLRCTLLLPLSRLTAPVS